MSKKIEFSVSLAPDSDTLKNPEFLEWTIGDVQYSSLNNQLGRFIDITSQVSNFRRNQNGNFPVDFDVMAETDKRISIVATTKITNTVGQSIERSTSHSINFITPLGRIIFYEYFITDGENPIYLRDKVIFSLKKYIGGSSNVDFKEDETSSIWEYLYVVGVPLHDIWASWKSDTSNFIVEYSTRYDPFVSNPSNNSGNDSFWTRLNFNNKKSELFPNSTDDSRIFFIRFKFEYPNSVEEDVFITDELTIHSGNYFLNSSIDKKSLSLEGNVLAVRNDSSSSNNNTQKFSLDLRFNFSPVNVTIPYFENSPLRWKIQRIDTSVNLQTGFFIDGLDVNSILNKTLSNPIVTVEIYNFNPFSNSHELITSSRIFPSQNNFNQWLGSFQIPSDDNWRLSWKLKIHATNENGLNTLVYTHPLEGFSNQGELIVERSF